MKKIKKFFPGLLFLLFLLSACSNNSVKKNLKKELNDKQEPQEIASSSENYSKENDYEIYKNEKYGLSFFYPNYLEIILDEEENVPTNHLWRLMVNSISNKASSSNVGLISNFSMDINYPATAKNFEELKYLDSLGCGSDAVKEGEEDKILPDQEFFTQIFKKPGDKVFIRVSALYEGAFVFFNFYGSYSEKEKVKEEAYKIIESFK
ncbi:MAG: hypothetical protein WC415_00645 [Patescibacteria group bacterium]|jgi:hypothetical protein